MHSQYNHEKSLGVIKLTPAPNVPTGLQMPLSTKIRRSATAAMVSGYWRALSTHSGGKVVAKVRSCAISLRSRFPLKLKSQLAHTLGRTSNFVLAGYLSKCSAI